MLKKCTLLLAFLMAFSFTLISGCAKKEAPKEEPASEQLEQAAPDTTQAAEQAAE
jgi:hypothetical protein